MSNPAGNVGGVLYCYGGCGRRYEDFGLDVILPTPLWNAIAIGEPFQYHAGDEREGRGGVLCACCIVERLAKLQGVTVAFMTVDRCAIDPALNSRTFAELRMMVEAHGAEKISASAFLFGRLA